MNRHQPYPNHFESSPATRMTPRTGAGMYVVSPLVCPASSTSTPVRGEFRSVNATNSAQITHPQSCYQVTNCTSGYVDSNVLATANATAFASLSTSNNRLVIDFDSMAVQQTLPVTPNNRDAGQFTAYFPDLSDAAHESEVGGFTHRRNVHQFNCSDSPGCLDDEIDLDDCRNQNEKPAALTNAESRWSIPLCDNDSCKVRGNPFSPPPASYSRPTYDPATMRRVVHEACPSPNPHYASTGILDRGLPFIERLELNWLKFRTKPHYHYRLNHVRENPEREAVIQRNSRKYFEWLNSNKSHTNPCASPALFRIDENANANVKAVNDPDEHVCDYLRTISDAVLLDRDPAGDLNKTPVRHSVLDFATSDYEPTLHPSLCKIDVELDRNQTSMATAKRTRTVCTQTAVTIPQDIDITRVIDFYLKKQAEFDREEAQRDRGVSPNANPNSGDNANTGANEAFRENENEAGANDQRQLEKQRQAHNANSDRPGGDTRCSTNLDTPGNASNASGRRTQLRRSRSSRNAVRPRKLYHVVDECDEQSNEAWSGGASQNSSNTSTNSNSSIETVKVTRPSSELAMHLEDADADDDADVHLRYAHIIAGFTRQPAFASPVCNMRSVRPDDVNMNISADDEVITGNGGFGVEDLVEPSFDGTSPFRALGNDADRFSSPCPAGQFPPYTSAKCIGRFLSTPNAAEDRFTRSNAIQSSESRRAENFGFPLRNETTPASGFIGRSVATRSTAMEMSDVSMSDGSTPAVSADLSDQPVSRKWEFNPNRPDYAT